jgi:uncharacterized protein YbjT (DUF2867 family)
MTILITGATGNIGSQVIHHLLDQKLPLRSLVRDLAKAAKLETQGIELVQGNFAQPDSLDDALQDIAKAFLVMPNDPHQVELECNFIDAAKRAGVRQIVKLSVLRSRRNYFRSLRKSPSINSKCQRLLAHTSI